MDGFLEEEEEEAAVAATKKKAAVGSALLPALHLPFLPPHLYQPGKGGAAPSPRCRHEGGRPPSAPALPPAGEAASVPRRLTVGSPPRREGSGRPRCPQRCPRPPSACPARRWKAAYALLLK